jgi:hypothetical protein
VNTTARRLLTGALALYGAYDLTHLGRGSLLDSVDLAIHETGHLVFGPFGEVIQFAGGTIMQILMPAAFVVYFVRRSDRHAASVALWWIAQNCGNIAHYIADAQAQELPLVGGGEHDWTYLLSHLGALGSDAAIARAVRFVGFLVLIVATAWGLASAKTSSEEEALAAAS